MRTPLLFLLLLFGGCSSESLPSPETAVLHRCPGPQFLSGDSVDALLSIPVLLVTDAGDEPRLPQGRYQAGFDGMRTDTLAYYRDRGNSGECAMSTPTGLLVVTMWEDGNGHVLSHYPVESGRSRILLARQTENGAVGMEATYVAYYVDEKGQLETKYAVTATVDSSALFRYDPHLKSRLLSFERSEPDSIRLHAWFLEQSRVRWLSE